jgi:hypothetical protein
MFERPKTFHALDRAAAVIGMHVGLSAPVTLQAYIRKVTQLEFFTGSPTLRNDMIH